MKLLQNFIVAFSMYSKIPMPHIEWTKENMKYAMCCFPFVGVVTGALEYLWWYVAGIAGFGAVFSAAVSVIIPVLVTGGIHLDGLLDTSDALSSWQTMEKRLEILKDSHAGAFAIIVCCAYFLAYFGIMTEANLEMIKVLAVGFVLSRTLSGLGVCSFPCAKGSGLVHTFADAAHKKNCRIVIIIEAVIAAVLMIYINPIPGIAGVIAAVIVCIACRHNAIKYFGGITGDTQGFFLQICELVMAFAVILTGHFLV